MCVCVCVFECRICTFVIWTPTSQLHTHTERFFGSSNLMATWCGDGNCQVGRIARLRCETKVLNAVSHLANETRIDGRVVAGNLLFNEQLFPHCHITRCGIFSDGNRSVNAHSQAKRRRRIRASSCVSDVLNPPSHTLVCCLAYIMHHRSTVVL